MTQDERTKLIDEASKIEANLETPAQLRRLNEIKSLLLSDGGTDKITVKMSNPRSSFFVKKSMTRATNSRRK